MNVRKLLIWGAVLLVLALLFRLNQGVGIVGLCLTIAWLCPLQLSPQPVRIRVVRGPERYLQSRRDDLN
jgi:hypothetical protein